MRHRARLAALLALLPLAAAAGPLGSGSPLPALDLEDQHGQRFGLPGETRHVVFAADKAGSDLVGTVLDGLPKPRLAALGVRYVADISAMPALVTRLFALPALRSKAYPVGLAREASLTADFPRQAGAATVLTVQNGQVGTVQFVRSAEALRHALGVGG